METPLCALYRVSDENLSLRKRYIGLNDRDVRALASVHPWAKSVAGKVARQFYDHQIEFEPTYAVFSAHADRQGVPLDELLEKLVKTQAAYFVDMFTEAAERGGRFGCEYFEQRLRVGKLHNEIDIPLKWYIGSYPVLLDLAHVYLRRRFPFAFGLRSRVERAMATVYNYDVQAIVESFYFDNFRAIGTDLEAIEVGGNEDLSASGGALKASVNESLRGIAHASARLRGISSQVASTVQEENRAARQISDSTEQVAQGANHQIDSVTQLETAMQKLRSSVEQVERRAIAVSGLLSAADSNVASMESAIGATTKASHAVRRVAGEAADSTQQGTQAVTASIDGMVRIRAVVNEIAQTVAQLSAKGSEIGTIVDTIENISEQTNLLALNATIEAARAGEFGRGFAVVADEVRKLAEHTSQATREVGALIAQLQRGTQDAVRATKSGGEEVARGSVLVGRAGEALEAIGGGVRETQEAVGDITSAAEAMSLASVEVVRALREVTALVDENDQALRGMTASASDADNITVSLASIAAKNATAASHVSGTTRKLSQQIESLVATAAELPHLAERLEQLSRNDNERALQSHAKIMFLRTG